MKKNKMFKTFMYSLFYYINVLIIMINIKVLYKYYYEYNIIIFKIFCINIIILIYNKNKIVK